MTAINFTNATVKATLSHYSSGTLFVEVSADGLNWQEACRLTPLTTGAVKSSVQTNLPASLLPTSQVFVRLRATGPMHVSSYKFEAEMASELPQAEGYTWFAGRPVVWLQDDQAALSVANQGKFLRLNSSHVRTVSLWVF